VTDVASGDDDELAWRNEKNVGLKSHKDLIDEMSLAVYRPNNNNRRKAT